MESLDASTEVYLTAFKGSFTSALRWPHLDALWAVLAARADQAWYVYAVGEPPPQQPLSAEDFQVFLNEINELLRHEHKEDYCGIVYADSLQEPRMVKIYDPNNLGVSCGYSKNPPLPGWVLSLLPPCDLPAAQAPPNNRKRWWQNLWRQKT